MGTLRVRLSHGPGDPGVAASMIDGRWHTKDRRTQAFLRGNVTMAQLWTPDEIDFHGAIIALLGQYWQDVTVVERIDNPVPDAPDRVYD